MTALYLSAAAIVFVYIYWLCADRFRKPLIAGGNALLLISFGPQFFALHLTSAIGNYFAAWMILKSGSRKAVLAFTIVANVALIIYFKIRNIGDANYIIPIGLSYYTLVNLGYVLEVGSKRETPFKSFFDFYVFSGFFPSITMGPIETKAHLAPQLQNEKKWSWSNFAEGSLLISFGLFKKFVIADRLHDFAYPLNRELQNFEGLGIWIFFLLCLLQIYCDFSSYIDLVRGFALWLGIRLFENFRQPYLARSIPEIWQRWNISLVNWLRQYLYLPTLMRTKSMYFASAVVMFAIALWHQISISAIFWGAYWTLLFWLHLFLRTRGIRIWRNAIFSSTLMILAMAFSTIFFASYSTEQLVSSAMRAFRPVFHLSSFTASLPFGALDIAVIVFGLILIVGIETIYDRYLRLRSSELSRNFLIALFAFVLFLSFITMLFGVSGSRAFIYTRF